MIFSTITQKGLELTYDLEKIPSQYSGDIEMKLIRDTTYNNYVCTPFFKHIKNRFLESNRNTKSNAIAIDSNGVFKLPKEAFRLDGYIAIAFSFARDSEVIQTNPIVYKITASVGDGEFLDNKPSWQQVVIQLCEDWTNENIKPDLGKMKKDIQNAIEEAVRQQTKVAEQQTALDNKFNELNTLENTVNENETNRQTNEIKRQNDTAKAIKSCNDKVTEINTKLLNGDFVGATGATPNITIGNVTLGNPNVTIRGTPEAPVLDFTIPSASNLSYATDADIDEMIIEVFG